MKMTSRRYLFCLVFLFAVIALSGVRISAQTWKIDGTGWKTDNRRSANFYFDFQSEGKVTVNITSGEHKDSETGTYSVNRNIVTMDFPNCSVQGDFSNEPDIGQILKFAMTIKPTGEVLKSIAYRDK